MRPSLEVMEPVQLADFKKGILVPQEDFEGWLQRFDWTYHQLARGEFPRPFTSLEEFQLACICADPVLWCQAFLRDPDNADHPWTFFDYQQESIRHTGNTIHECGAEVGKTREITSFILWKAFTTEGGSGLVTGPMLAHCLEIVDGLLEQLSLNKDLGKALGHHRKHPHHNLKFSNRFKLDVRPMGYDGEALRGIHAATFVISDEAAKAKNPDIFKELWRAGKPGCEYKLYSTPDGDRSSPFFKLCQRASETNHNGKDDKDEQGKNLEFKKFHWSKELMPAPFWTPERRRFYIEQYGGEDSPGYQQNVLGNWGDPENSVFPWYQFERLLKDIPEYRCLKILVDDSQGEVTLFGTRYVMPAPTGADGEVPQTTTTPFAKGDYSSVKPHEQILCERRLMKKEFNIRTEIRAFFSNLPGLKFGGCDLGFSQDPSELSVWLVVGRVYRRIARVQLKGVSYDQQADAIDALDDVYDAGEKSLGWGVDYGNAGSAVVHILQNQDQYISKRYENRMTGFQFGGMYDAVDEEGEIIIDKHTEKPVRLSGKELSTDLLVKKMQRQELEFPYDPDLILYYPNHTYRQGPKHRIFKDKDDHAIDADRVMILRAVLPGEDTEDIFV